MVRLNVVFNLKSVSELEELTNALKNVGEQPWLSNSNISEEVDDSDWPTNNRSTE